MNIEKTLQFKCDENGFITEFMNIGSEAILPNGISFEINDNFNIEDFQKNYQAYQFKNNKLERNEEQYPLIIEENTKEELRYKREKECFSVINRGFLWYENLSSFEKKELNDWYKQWLDVTDTKVVPSKPEWLK